MRRLSLAVATFMLDSKRSSILVTKAPSLIVYFETLPVGAGSDTAPMVASGLYGPAVRRRYMATGVAPSTGGGSVVVSWHGHPGPPPAADITECRARAGGAIGCVRAGDAEESSRSTCTGSSWNAEPATCGSVANRVRVPFSGAGSRHGAWPPASAGRWRQLSGRPESSGRRPQLVA